MKVTEFVHLYPQLHHMAEAGAWQTIQQIGLLTTRQLVDGCNLDPEVRKAILGGQRKKQFSLTHPVVGPITIRDQKPLARHNLEPVLTDMTVQQWLDVLNNRVFLWAHPRRLATLLNARSYRHSSHDVLVVDTARLVETHADRIRLTGMNTGATIFPNMPKRGSDTFQPINTFPFDERRRARRAIHDNVVEVAVLDGLPDIIDFVVRVENRIGPTVAKLIYEA